MLMLSFAAALVPSIAHCAQNGAHGPSLTATQRTRRVRGCRPAPELYTSFRRAARHAGSGQSPDQVHRGSSWRHAFSPARAGPGPHAHGGGPQLSAGHQLRAGADSHDHQLDRQGARQADPQYHDFRFFRFDVAAAASRPLHPSARGDRRTHHGREPRGGCARARFGGNRDPLRHGPVGGVRGRPVSDRDHLPGLQPGTARRTASASRPRRHQTPHIAARRHDDRLAGLAGRRGRRRCRCRSGARLQPFESASSRLRRWARASRSAAAHS